MTSYNWNILQMLTLPIVNNQTDVVVSAQWKLSGIDGTYEGVNYGWTNFTLKQGEEFTPYNELTENQVLGWVQAELGVENIAQLKFNIQRKIDEQKSSPPTPEPQPLPWSS